MKLRTVLFCVTLASLGCSSSEEIEDPKLPFHVALAPIQIDLEDVKMSPDAEDASTTELQIPIDAEELTNAIEEKLRESCFSQVYVLEGNKGSWASEAKSKNADLVIETTVSKMELVKTAKNDRFWLNLPFFFLGGPFNYFIEDRDYFVGIQLVATVYEYGKFGNDPFAGQTSETSADENQDTLTIRPSEDSLTASYVPIERVPLNFWDRGSNFGHYFFSFFIPANFLANESDNAQAALGERIEEELAQRLTEDFLRNSKLFEQPAGFPFYVEDFAIKRGSVELILASNYGSISKATINGDEVDVRPMEEGIDSKDPDASDQVIRYAIKKDISKDDDLLRLIVQSGAASNRIWRSFTFDLKPTEPTS